MCVTALVKHVIDTHKKHQTCSSKGKNVYFASQSRESNVSIVVFAASGNILLCQTCSWIWAADRAQG